MLYSIILPLINFCIHSLFLQVDKARELVEEIEAIFKPEFYLWCEPTKIGQVTVKGIYFFVFVIYDGNTNSCTVLEGQGLPKKDVIGSSDPFVVLELDSQKQQTKVIKDNLNPKWENQQFSLYLILFNYYNVFLDVNK